jgi:hypothetical protein
MPDTEIAPGPLVGGPVVAAVMPGRGPGRRTMPLTDHVTC